MTIAQVWAVRRLRAEILRLRIAVGLLVVTGIALLLMLETPLPGLLAGLAAFFLQAAVSSRSKHLRRLERALRDESAGE